MKKINWRNEWKKENKFQESKKRKKMTLGNYRNKKIILGNERQKDNKSREMKERRKIGKNKINIINWKWLRPK